MTCMKCGKKTKDEQVFCPSCLTSMESYPVKPDVRVQLPNRQKSASSKKTGRKRHAVPAEEQVVHLRKALRRMAAISVLLAILLCVTGAMLLRATLGQNQTDVELGKNYTYNSLLD